MVYRIKIDNDKWVGKGIDPYMYSGKYRKSSYYLALSFNSYQEAEEAVEWCKDHKIIKEYYEIIAV